jgi:hypothetical protein
MGLIMHQLEIQFFWPLTEQIPLELDYEGCAVQKTPTYTSSFTYDGLISTQVNWGTPVLKLAEDTVTFTYKEEPPWYRKILFKLLGIKLEKY